MALIIRPADIIKAKVIDYLIAQYDGVIIGDEVMYGSSRKIVDLLALYQDETFAIEIKSDKDDLRRLPVQLIEYSKIFDHTMIVTTIEHMAMVRKVAKSKVSVFEVGDEKIEGTLIGKRNNVLKSEMLATMNSAYIRKKLNISGVQDSDQVRRKALCFKKEKIHSLLFEYFLEKLSSPYQLFMKERKEKTEIDDIVLLSNRLNIE